MSEIRTLLTGGRYFEGPRWHGDRLLMVDSLARRIVSVDASGNASTVCEIEGISGGMGVLPNGDLIVTSMFDRKLLVYRQGKLAETIDLGDVAAGTIDDMIVSSDGRIYVGDLGIDLMDPKRQFSAGRGRILLLAPGEKPRVVGEGLSFPNGIALSGDGRLLVVAESDGDCLTRFEIMANGSLGKPVRFGRFGEPDGVCIDTANCVWVSLFKEDAFVRVALDGRELQRISVAGRRAIACALGGRGRETLFGITADTTHEDLMRGKSDANVIAVEVEAGGSGSP